MNTHAHMLSPGQVRALVEENETLKEALKQTQEAMAPKVPLPAHWRLSPQETTLVRALYRVAPKVLTREQCLVAIYGVTAQAAPNQDVFDVYLCRLRRKLRQCGSPIEIRTVRQIGYYLDAASRDHIDDELAGLGSPAAIAAE